MQILNEEPVSIEDLLDQQTKPYGIFFEMERKPKKYTLTFYSAINKHIPETNWHRNRTTKYALLLKAKVYL